MFYIVLQTLLSIIYTSNNCTSSLECATACCKDNQCVENDICKQDIRNVYIAVGLVGLGFIIVISIYFIWSIRETRKNVRKLRDSENANKVK